MRVMPIDINLLSETAVYLGFKFQGFGCRFVRKEDLKNLRDWGKGLILGNFFFPFPEWYCHFISFITYSQWLVSFHMADLQEEFTWILYCLWWIRLRVSAQLKRAWQWHDIVGVERQYKTLEWFCICYISSSHFF